MRGRLRIVERETREATWDPETVTRVDYVDDRTILHLRDGDVVDAPIPANSCHNHSSLHSKRQAFTPNGTHAAASAAGARLAHHRAVLCGERGASSSEQNCPHDERARDVPPVLAAGEQLPYRQCQHGRALSPAASWPRVPWTANTLRRRVSACSAVSAPWVSDPWPCDR